MTTRKSTGLPTLVVLALSPDKTYDSLFMATYANINLNDSLARVQGVGDRSIFGASDYAMRVWVNRSAGEVGFDGTDLSTAVRQQSAVKPGWTIEFRACADGQRENLHGARAGRLQSRRSSGRSWCARTRTDRSCGSKTWRRIELGALN